MALRQGNSTVPQFIKLSIEHICRPVDDDIGRPTSTEDVLTDTNIRVKSLRPTPSQPSAFKDSQILRTTDSTTSE